MCPDASFTDRRRRLPSRIVLVVASGIVVFSVTHGVEQYWIAQSSTTTIAGRPATPTELISIFLIDEAVLSAPFGAVAAIAFTLILAPLAWRLRRWSTSSGLFVGGMLGCGVGFVLSIVLWLISGGWGPPFLIPAILSGAVTGSGIVAVVQWLSHARPAG